MDTKDDFNPLCDRTQRDDDHFADPIVNPIERSIGLKNLP
jgi:hypothetical protein